MHKYRCSGCGGFHYSLIAPEYTVSTNPWEPDSVPIVCACRTGAFIYYYGWEAPYPMAPQPWPAPQRTAHVPPPRGLPAVGPTNAPRHPTVVARTGPPVPANANVTTPAPERWAIQELKKEHYESALALVLSRMTEHDVLLFRLVSQAHRDLAERIMKGWFTAKRFKYAVSRLTGMEQFIRERIAEQHSVRISVDQLTNPKLIDRLVGRDVGKLMGVNAGRLATYKIHGVEHTRSFGETFGKYASQSAVIELPGNEKMHNKFYVLGKEGGGGGVITGSPNLSESGLGNNQECIVFIQHPMIQILFREYFERIRSHDAAVLKGGVKSPSRKGLSDGAFSAEIVRFNTDSPVRVALAPFLNIRDFVYQELQGANGAAGVKITMRQFVVDRPTAHHHDIMEALVALRKAGAAVSVVLDYGQHQTASTGYGKKQVFYVQEACKRLVDNGVTVYLQKSGESIMHEKLLLIEFTKSEKKTKTVLIGSAGFTKNVSENLNYENIVAIDEDAVYDYFMQWHVASIDPKRNLSQTFAVRPGELPQQLT